VKYNYIIAGTIHTQYKVKTGYLVCVYVCSYACSSE